MNTNKHSTKTQNTQLDKKILNLVDSDELENSDDNLRNPGVDFSLDMLSNISINRSAVERRCSDYGPRRSIKKDNQAAWLLKAISLIDLTTLSGDDTVARVRRLCSKAKQPISHSLERELGTKS